MKTLRHKFVEFIPEAVADGVLYISVEYCTATHKCVCGCGNEVVTPLSPTDWRLTFDGDSVSLHPSIGNWNFECQSHYWVTDGQIRHAGKWTPKEIERGRQIDNESKTEYFESRKAESSEPKVGWFNQMMKTLFTYMRRFFRSE